MRPGIDFIGASLTRRARRGYAVFAIAASTFLFLLSIVSTASAGCDFASFWSGGCNKKIEKALTPPPPSKWIPPPPPPPPPPACGKLNQRPCTVVERLPSCDNGLTESIAQNRCIETPPGKLPFFATLNEMGALVVRAGVQSQAQCLAQGNADAQRAPSGLFNSPAFRNVDAQRLKYVAIGFGCAAPRMLDTFQSLADVDPIFWRNFEIAFNQKFNGEPCVRAKNPAARASCAVGKMMVDDSISETVCLIKAAQSLPDLAGSTSGADTIKAYNQLGEGIFIALQWTLEQYISARLAGPAKEKFKQKVIDRTIASDMARGKHGAHLQRDYVAKAQKIDRIFKVVKYVMFGRAVGNLYDRMKTIPECGGTVSPSTGVTTAMAKAASNVARGSSVMVGPGSLYAVNAQGQLLYFKHNAKGLFTVSGKVIGTGWSGKKFVRAARLPSGGGAIYMIDQVGDLYYYEHDANGAFSLQKKIGSGWGAMRDFFVGRKGLLYAIQPNGDLQVFRHDNAFNFYLAAKKIGTGWNDGSRIISGGSNAFYMVRGDAKLYYYYHDEQYNWKVQRKAIGTGWNLPQVASSGNGELYAVNAFGDLLFYRHDTAARFLGGSGSPIGIGFSKPGPYGLIVPAR